MSEPQDLNQVFIKDLRLSRRTFHALHRNGVYTVGKLRGLLESNKLDEINLIGKKSLDEILNALDELQKQLPEAVYKENTPIVSFHETIGEDVNNTPLEILELRAPVRGSLIKNGIKTIGDLRSFTDEMLLSINRIGPKVLAEIRQALKFIVDNPSKYQPIDIPTVDDTEGRPEDNEEPLEEEKVIVNWAELVQSYFESEKDNYTYILLSRFGYKPKKLEEIARELDITRERVRQIQLAATVRFLNYLRMKGSVLLLERIHEILSEYGEDLSLKKFKQKLEKENLLGKFSASFMEERISKVDLFDALICWLNLLSDSRYSQKPVKFPVDILTLVHSTSVSIKDSKSIQNIPSKSRRKIKRKIYFTGGINIKEAIKILSLDEKTAELVLKSLNLRKLEDSWYSLKKYDVENDGTKIPLRIAGLKMLSVQPEIEFEKFCDGLRRHSGRFYTSIAPLKIIEHVLPMLGFEINNRKVTTKISITGALSQSEESLVSAISKNDGIASFLEIAEEFFLQKLSLPAVSVTLKRSPIVEKLDDGLYILRGTEISWQQIENAKKRQRRFSQDDDVTHGLDGVIRMRLTVNSYTYLTGVVGAYKIKELPGSWYVVYNDESYGNAKIDEAYLWGLSKVFKKLDVKMGDRIELRFNTWNRKLSVEKVSHGTS